jgi:hypothetical protein
MKQGTQSDTSERRFPVLLTQREARDMAPRTVPWSLLAPHEEQALRNHDQSLDVLARRGGLAPAEMVAVLEDRKWRDMMFDAAVARLEALVLAHETGEQE